MSRRKILARDQSGQAVLEYLLLVSVLVMIFFSVQQGLKRLGLAKALMAPIQNDYGAAYQYGHVKAKGWDNGGPTYHPRVVGGDNNFRLFINPGAQ